MNVKVVNSITASALLLAALYPSSSPATGTGGKCTELRPLSASEQSGFLAAMRTIRNAMPPAPEGWTAQHQDPGGAVPVLICAAAGSPLGATFQASYTNEKNILESIRKFERGKSAAKMEKLADEMSEAAERGDSKKLQALQQELDGLNASPAGRIAARVIVRINLVKTAGNIRGGSEYPVPGAKYGYLVEEKRGKRLVFFLGRWNRRGEFGVYPEIAKDQPNSSVQVIEVIIEGDIAEALAKTMNVKALDSLTR